VSLKTQGMIYGAMGFIEYLFTDLHPKFFLKIRLHTAKLRARNSGAFLFTLANKSLLRHPV